MEPLIKASALWLAVAPIDMRCGIDRLTMQVSSVLEASWQNQAAFVFRNRPGTRIKMLLWDEQGVWLCNRRLHKGRFHWPRSEDKVWELNIKQYEWLILGVDWLRLESCALASWQNY
jgi:transposase